MPATYEPIATNTLGSASSSITFSSIPGTYTDLILVFVGAQTSTAQGDLQFRFNSDTGSNYSRTILSGNGTTASSNRSSDLTFFRGEATSYPDTVTGGTNQILHLMNYSNTTTNKTILFRGNSAASGTDLTAGLWRSTSAITAIECYMSDSATLKAGSMFTLYGIKSA
jgi:hypothetical protein